MTAQFRAVGLQVAHVQRHTLARARAAVLQARRLADRPRNIRQAACERVAGLSRILRGNALAGLENISLWHERDITHSSVERVIFPDSTILLHYMITTMQTVIKKTPRLEIRAA